MMIRCDGARKGYSLPCNGSLYRCAHGNVRCRQTRDGTCGSRAFRSSIRASPVGLSEHLDAGPAGAVVNRPGEGES